MDPRIALACGVPYRLLDERRRSLGIEIAGRDMQDLLQGRRGVLGVFARSHRMNSKLVDRGFVNFIIIDSSVLETQPIRNGGRRHYRAKLIAFFCQAAPPADRYSSDRLNKQRAARLAEKRPRAPPKILLILSGMFISENHSRARPSIAARRRARLIVGRAIT